MTRLATNYLVGNEPDDLVWRTSALFPLGDAPRVYRDRPRSGARAGTLRPFGLHRLTVVTPKRVMPLSDISYCPVRQVSVLKTDTDIEYATKETYDSPYRTREDNQYYDDHEEDTRSD